MHSQMQRNARRLPSEIKIAFATPFSINQIVEKSKKCNGYVFHVGFIGAVLKKRITPRVRHFNADHPFIFTIHHKAELLILGRIENI